MMYGAGTLVYLSAGATDLRKSIDGLAQIVSLTFNLDPCSKALFVFCNKKRNRVKILEWEHNGFWLHIKRLERGRFKWPKGEGAQEISERELRWLLDGLDHRKTRGHLEVKERAVA
jgi:transposase